MTAEVTTSPAAVVADVLRAARCHLGMDAAYVSRVTDLEQVIGAVDAGPERPSGLHPGARVPLADAYCQRVVAHDEPWVIPDTAAEPAVADLAATTEAPIGAYVGVPVRLPDGTVYGTLCGASRQPEPHIGPRDAQVLQVLADVLGCQLAREEHHVRRVTALRRGARQHRLQAAMFRRLFDLYDCPVLIVDPVSRRVEYANTCLAGLLRRRGDELEGRPLSRLHPALEALAGGELGPLLQGTQTVRRFEWDPAGLPPLEVVAQRVSVEAAGDVVLLVGRDISVRRRAEQQLRSALEREQRAAAELRELSAMKSAFLSAVSHELRTPLTTVCGASELLYERRVSADQYEQLVGRLLESARQLQRLLSDLLDLNRFVHGRLEVRRQRVRLDQLVREAVAQVDVGDRPLTLRTEPVEVAVEPVKVERIAVNLVANAVAHTPSGTPVEVRVAATDGGALLVVADRGPGVPPELREAVFEPFEQGPSRLPHSPGTGIGLSLVAAFARLHGGRAWVEDTPGGGATFTVFLPGPGA